MGEKITLTLKAFYDLLENAYMNGFNQKDEYKKFKTSVVDECLKCSYRTKSSGSEYCKDCKLAEKFMQKD